MTLTCGTDDSLRLRKVNRRNCRHLSSTGKMSSIECPSSQQISTSVNIYGRFQFSVILYVGHISKHLKILHLAAVPENLRGNSKHCYNLKCEGWYLEITCIASPEVQLLEFHQTNFVVQ